MKEIKLIKNERIDDLQLNGLKIIQNTEGFCFGIDSVILSEFAKNIKNNANVVDLGTGTGILGFLLCGKTNLKTVTGIEIQEDVAAMAKKSIELNELNEKFKIIEANITDIFKNKLLEKNKYDVVITNPPYKELGTGIINIDEKYLKVVDVAIETAKLKQTHVIALELNNGKIVTGKQTDLLSPAASVVINAIKELSKVPDDIDLLSRAILKPILELKKDDNILSLTEVLIALSICGVTNPVVANAIKKLKDLENCEAHASYMVRNGDFKALKNLKINLTCEPEFYRSEIM